MPLCLHAALYNCAARWRRFVEVLFQPVCLELHAGITGLRATPLMYIYCCFCASCSRVNGRFGAVSGTTVIAARLHQFRLLM